MTFARTKYAAGRSNVSQEKQRANHRSTRARIQTRSSNHLLLCSKVG